MASLLLARGAGRQQEMAIVASLGACRTRIFSQQIMESLLERCSALPRMERAAVTTKLPIEGGTSNGTILVEGDSYDPEGQRQLVERSYVSPGYFEAMGIPLLAGRVMEWDEGSEAERVVVVNRALATSRFLMCGPWGRS